MQQIETNTKMKHQNKPLPTISSKYHVNANKICVPIGRFVSMSSIYEPLKKQSCNLKRMLKL